MFGRDEASLLAIRLAVRGTALAFLDNYLWFTPDQLESLQARGWQGAIARPGSRGRLFLDIHLMRLHFAANFFHLREHSQNIAAEDFLNIRVAIPAVEE